MVIWGIDSGSQELAAMLFDNEEVSGYLIGMLQNNCCVLWGIFHIDGGRLHPKETHILVVLAN